MKDGIYIQLIIPINLEDNSFWYIMAVKNNQILYLHKQGFWHPSCYNPMLDRSKSFSEKDGHYSGHYETKEKAIETLKFFTDIKIINEGEMI